MRILPFFLFLAVALEAQNEAQQAILSQQGKQMFQTEQKTAQQGVQEQITTQAVQQQKQAVAATAAGGTADIMIVDPKIIADDWVGAFRTLQDKKVGGLSFIIHGAQPINNVLDIEPLPGGYLMLFTLKTLQGFQYQIVKTSTISTIVSK